MKQTTTLCALTKAYRLIVQHPIKSREMKTKNILLAFMFFSVLLVGSCKDYLDVPPPNIVKNEDIFKSKTTLMLYVSRIYSQMPYADFKYTPRVGYFHDFLVVPGVNEGASIGRDGAFAMTGEGSNLWPGAYGLLRDINRMLEVLPAYRANFIDAEYNHFLGEAYHARAVVFYEMAKRFGGIPLTTKVAHYPEEPVNQLELPRSTEEQTWNQILSDFDSAAVYLAPTSPIKGMVNKYITLAFKSEAMLYAGSIAKYNTITGFGDKTKVRVIGFDPNTKAAASKKYFSEAYKAAMEVIKSGRYELYKKKWSADDRQAQMQNMIDMFFDKESRENIFIKEYSYPDLTHGYDAYNIPRQLAGGNGYSSGNNPTLEYVSMFDGIPKNPNGSIQVIDANNKYILFDKITDLFKNAEPRLKANVILPGEPFKGQPIDIRAGVYTGDAANGISPLRSIEQRVDYSLSGPVSYTDVDAYKGTGAFKSKVLFMSSQKSSPEVVTLPNGKKMNASGESGPYYEDRVGAMTGFTIRKYLNPNMPQELVLEARSEHHFILMRLAEVVLNLAESAAELNLAGEPLPDAMNATEVIYQSISQIRERAGANPLQPSEIFGEGGLQMIRRERKKELSFENKILWDIRRWRTQTKDVINGFTQQDGTFYSGLYPFYSTSTNKYFFDAGPEIYRMRYRMTEPEYYFMLPGNEVSKSPLIDQQPGR